MEVTDDVVKHIEALARLDLTDQERSRLGADLARILDYVAQLEELKAEDVPPTTHILATEQILRTDEPADSLPQDQALRNAPRQDGEYFQVPPVIGGEEEGEHA